MPIKLESDIRTEITQGLAAAWPVCLGYVPLGLAFGVLAQKAGLHPLQIGFMSLLVFAGSAQFIAISMLSSGAAITSIIFTTLMVNLRHLLMSSALSVYLTRAKRIVLPLFAYGITDESFAVNLSKFKYSNWNIKRALVVNHASNISWIASTVAGGYSGQFIPAKAFGIDYALISMFICLLIFQLRGRKYIITAIIAGASAVILSVTVPGNSYIILASILAATLGVVLRKWIKKV
ncbi:MAG: AzlC family ABC transporter permease [Dehalococcoidia bacterium]|nr:AzlC family ABC transporter permease [Dehalococcoidia bacterium]MDH5781114.1 AzlC family ABC transporter permease [Dehalococcoidia bacterium]